MALVNCPECGRENVSDTALACPSCGYPIGEHFKKTKLEKEEHRNFECESVNNEDVKEVTTKEQKKEGDTDNEVFQLEKGKKPKKKQILSLVIIAAVILIINVFSMNPGKKATTKNKVVVSEIDMTTSLIKDGSMIPADQAYQLIQERLLNSLGDDYTYEVQKDSGFIGILNKGASRYSYLIICAQNRTLFRATSNKKPNRICIYDTSSSKPSVKRLSFLISTVLDNTDQSTIESVLNEKKENYPDKTFPDEFSIAINKRVFDVIPDTEGGAYVLELAGDFYDYSNINPIAALNYIFGNNEAERNKIAALNWDQAQFLVEYYTEHEQEYFENYEALLIRSGMKTESGLSDENKSASNEKSGKNSQENDSTTLATGESQTYISPTANKVSKCADDIYKFMNSFEASPSETNIFDLAPKQVSLDNAIEEMAKSGVDPEVLVAAQTISRRVSTWSEVAMTFKAMRCSMDDLSSARSDVKSAIDDFSDLIK